MAIEKVKALYDPNWTQAVKKNTLMDGIIAIKLSEGHLYVLVSRNPDQEDIETYYDRYRPHHLTRFIDAVMEVLNHGHEMAFSKAKEVFPGEYAKLEKLINS